MSNLEKDPPELVEVLSGSATSHVRQTTVDGDLAAQLDKLSPEARGTGATSSDVELMAGVGDEQPGPVEILSPRDVPLGGPRAMRVRRTLPQRGRTAIGAWCFLDHYGPEDVSVSGGMHVPPHPHTGLQTVSCLFSGEIEHRDSTGVHQMVRPGELNLMTAGRGIQHSEVSTARTSILHGVQLWTVLPDAARHTSPFFEHHESDVAQLGDARVRVFVGALPEQAATRHGRLPASAATTFSPLVAAEIELPAGAELALNVDPSFEHGVLVDEGEVRVESTKAEVADLAYLPVGRRTITITAGEAHSRVVLIGGEPLNEQIVMWWNFIGRNHDEILEYRNEWQRDVIEHQDDNGRFGHVDGFDGPSLPAPALPNVRLRPRE